jgi:WS/DGAT/MGAT family acyltransferase
LVEVPFNLDHPYWIDDPNFDLGYHVRHLGLAPPGAADQLGDQVARIVSRPMDRTRPLWESYVIEGLCDGRWALLTKTHHASIDGAAGVILLSMLTDSEADPQDAPEPVEWEGEPVPSDLALLVRTMKHALTNPVKGLQVQARLVREVADNLGIKSVGSAMTSAAEAVRALLPARGRGLEPEPLARLALRPAPPTPWNRTISAQRRFAARAVSLPNIKALKDATGGTVNDIVMAICSGALRQYLLDHDALPTAPLRAMVPVSLRTFEEEEPWTNRVSALIVELPTNVDDPLRRVELCHQAMISAKHQFELMPASTLIEASQLAPSIVASSVMRLLSRLRLADRVTLPVNVVISNVPGPREPLYLVGSKMVAYVPVSIVTDGLGLNIYLDRVDFGLVADRELVPDLWDLVDLHIAELAVLFEASGAERVEDEPPAEMRRGGHTGPAGTAW